MTHAEAQTRADIYLAESWAGRETAQFALLPSTANLIPGDVVTIAGNDWRIKTLKAGTVRKVQAEAHDAAIYDAAPATPRP